MGNQQIHSLLCIVCPEGCEMEIVEQDGKLQFPTGICARGKEYARQEIYEPARVLTTTVQLLGADIAMMPVRTPQPIPKEKMLPAMDLIASIRINAPVSTGDTVVTNLLGTGVPLLACRDAESQDG